MRKVHVDYKGDQDGSVSGKIVDEKGCGRKNMFAGFSLFTEYISLLNNFSLTGNYWTSFEKRIIRVGKSYINKKYV